MLEDIETLNRRSRTGELEVTAVSFATYLLIAEQYRMMDPGASMGKGYGPILVAREPIPVAELDQRVVAIPGKHTTAALLLRLYVGDPPLIEVAFDKIPQAVLDGQADLGLLDPRGPDHAPEDGPHQGARPRRDLAARHRPAAAARRQRHAARPRRRDLHRALSQALRDSIAWAHANVDEALEYAMRYGRGIDKETCRRFVLMYVNDFTLALGREGRAAIDRLFALAHQKGLIPAVPRSTPCSRPSPGVGRGMGAGPRRPRAWWPTRTGLGWAPSDGGRAFLVWRETGPRGPAPSPDRRRVAGVTARSWTLTATSDSVAGRGSRTRWCAGRG